MKKKPKHDWILYEIYLQTIIQLTILCSEKKTLQGRRLSK